MRVLLTGGGSAGHINPALAIAEIIKRHDPHAVIEFVGINGGKECDLVPREGYKLHFVRSMGIRRSLSPKNIKALWLALTSPYSKETVGLVKAFKPDIVIGTGGYASWPLMASACRMGIPTAVHESNALPGLAVRKLQGKVDRVWLNFEKTRELLKPSERVIKVGNPLRNGFSTISYTEARKKLGIRPEQTFILSFGGSLGAEEVNRAAILLMHSVIAKDPKLLHIHAAGKRDLAESQKQYKEAFPEGKENCILVEYIYDMPTYMAAADLVISRAGAMTLSELALMQKPVILIPSPYVADNHQYKNAKTLADACAAVLVEERELPEGRLTEKVRELLSAPTEREILSREIASFADRRVNDLIWQEITELTKGS